MPLNNSLAIATITLQKINEISLYQSELVSTNGNLFHPYDIETTLIFNVFKNSERITDLFTDIEWHKFSSDADSYIEDVLWGEQHRNKSVINFTKNDFKQKCIIQVDAYKIINDKRVCVTSARITLLNVNDLQNNTEPPQNPEDGCLWVDSSGLVPIIKSWNALQNKWIVVGETKPFVRNLIQNSNFWRLNYDGFTEENYNFLNDLKVTEYMNKNWLRIKSYKETEGVDTSAGIFQKTSYPIEKKSHYTLSFLCRHVYDEQYTGSCVYIKVSSLDKNNTSTTIKISSIDVPSDPEIISLTFETLDDTESIKILIGVEPMALSEFYITEISLYNTDKLYPWELSPEDTVAQIENKLNNDHESVFNALTRNGTMEGIYTSTDENGKEHFYFNGTHIKAGSIDGGLINGIGLNIKDEDGISIFHVYRDDSGTHIDMHAENLYIGPNRKEATTVEYVDSVKSDTLEYTDTKLQENKSELENKISNDIQTNNETLVSDLTQYVDESLNIVKTETSIEINQSKQESISASQDYTNENLSITSSELIELIESKTAETYSSSKGYTDNKIAQVNTSSNENFENLLKPESSLRVLISKEIDDDILTCTNNVNDYTDGKVSLLQQQIDTKEDKNHSHKITDIENLETNLNKISRLESKIYDNNISASNNGNTFTTIEDIINSFTFNFEGVNIASINTPGFVNTNYIYTQDDKTQFNLNQVIKLLLYEIQKLNTTVINLRKDLDDLKNPTEENPTQE